MKLKYTLIYLLTTLIANNVMAQNLSTRSSEFSIDLLNNKNLNGDIPIVKWESPIPDISFSEDGMFKIKLSVTSNTPLKSVSINIIDTDTNISKGKKNLNPTEDQQHNFLVENNLFLRDGNMSLEITAENLSGIKTITSKRVYVGDKAIASSRLDRSDYALLFATDKYENWNDLVNPIFDTRTIAEILRKDYGFEVDIVENASQNEVLSKIREYAEKNYRPMDQLFVFFAGHGTYDQTFGEGFVVTTESMINDEGKTSYLSHNRLRSIVNNIPSDHIFLSMDVCFGGTFDEQLASSRGMDEVYKEQEQSEFISRKLLSKTRKYLTSGGKTYVSDGIAGEHSPYARKFIDALSSKGGADGILTLTEIFGMVEKLKIQPRMGAFGGDEPNSDFLFIAR